MNELTKIKTGLSGFWIKMIAIVTMLIDHLGAAIFPEQLWMRYIGRLAFPIFCYLIVEGFIHTKDVNKYGARLLIFALISEIPFDLAFYGTAISWEHQNVFFTLFLGLLSLIVISGNGVLISKIISVVLAMIAAWSFGTDYGGAGVLLIVCFYLFRNNKWKSAIAFFVINFFFITRYSNFEYLWKYHLFWNFYIQDVAFLSILPIGLYNGTRGYNMKWFFYLFYPVHLLLIFLCIQLFLQVS